MAGNIEFDLGYAAVLKGMTAYEYAKSRGYTGTEEEYAAACEEMGVYGGKYLDSVNGASSAAAAASSAAEAATAAANELKVSVSNPFVVAATAAAMTDTTKAYVYTGSETGYVKGGWYYWNGSAWVLGGTAVDPSLSVSGAAADAAACGELKSDINNIENVQISYQSSQLTGTGTVANDKRILLNVDTPIPSGIKLGLLRLVANDSSISATITVELTHKNQDGSYTVYDSMSESVSLSGFSTGDLISVLNVGKTTSGETYVFVSITGAAYPRVRMASVTGKIMRLCDSTSGTTFTTRDLSGYEVLYLLLCGITDNYIVSNNKNINELQNAVGDYECHEFFNASQSSGFWNCYIYKNIPTGAKVRITMLDNSANLKFNVRAYDANNNNQLILGTFKDVGGTTEATLTLNAVHIRIQAPISTAISNAKLAVVVTTDTQPGLVSDLFDSSIPKVYHVEKDGSGDFTNLAKAIEVATQWFDSVVYVGAGTWDILEELGQDYLDSASASNQGIVLKNRVHVICSSKAYIKCLYSGSDADVIDHISAFNAGSHGFTLENADIEVANVRYCVHDERNAETDHYDNYYINCRMKNTNQTAGSRSQCIGGGLGYDGHVVIEGCTFENPLRDNYGIVSYHNAHGLADDSRSLIEVKGCYFYGTNTFRAGYYGYTTKVTQCLVHGNSMGSAPFVSQEDPNFSNVNMEIIAWNNEIRN